ncbi:hypothetical protein Vretimale_13616 [Volvox reticuliferus]|uniref:Retrotransposon gag domain-containing protein n=1 Tax=Volvox reticuliferus TaxID=1737510 RepID=A0A8J4GLS8_9CHLO|nr:hypothetical protein Vretifemale_447 [Volvox reticuliferus]GIM09803.1 hypothetical protein Vretimale_13616 [Volvox reticuliferus]
MSERHSETVYGCALHGSRADHLTTDCWLINHLRSDHQLIALRPGEFPTAHFRCQPGCYLHGPNANHPTVNCRFLLRLVATHGRSSRRQSTQWEDTLSYEAQCIAGFGDNAPKLWGEQLAQETEDMEATRVCLEPAHALPPMAPVAKEEGAIDGSERQLSDQEHACAPNEGKSAAEQAQSGSKPLRGDQMSATYVEDFDYEADIYEMETVALSSMSKFSHEQLPAFKAAANRVMTNFRILLRYQKGHVPVDDAIDILNGFPTPETPYDLWHQSTMEEVKSAATIWLREKTGDPSVELDGESLLAFYLESLEKHFEPQRRRAKFLQYVRLKQGELSPMSYLQELQVLIPYMKSKYSEQAIAEKYIEGLNTNVRERIEDKYCFTDNSELYGMLNEIAEDAERVWMNLQLKAVIKDKPRKTPQVNKMATTPTVRLSKAESCVSSADTSRYCCSYHGANSTHDIKDCRVLHSRKMAARTSANASNCLVEQGQLMRAGMMLEKSVKPAKQHTPPASAANREKDRPTCEYCGRFGHSEAQCYVQYPDKAPATFRAPTKALQEVFEWNLKDLCRQQQQQE